MILRNLSCYIKNKLLYSLVMRQEVSNYWTWEDLSIYLLEMIITNEQMNKCKENCVSSRKTSAQDVEQIHWLHISWNRKVQCHQWSPEQKQYQSCLLPTVGLDYTISFVLILCAVAGSFMMELCCAVHTKTVCLRRQWYEYESHF